MKIWKIMVVITLAVALVLGVALPGLAASDAVVTQASNFTSSDEPPAWGKKFPRIVRGEVLSVDEVEPKSFVIQSGEQELTIFVDENTRYFILRPPKKLLGLAQQRMELRLQDQEMASAIEPAVTMQLRVLGRIPQPKGILEHQRAKLKWLRHFGEEATFADMEVGDKVVALLVPGEDKPTAKVVLIIKPSVWGRITGTITDVSSNFITIEPVSGGDEIPLEYTENTFFILKGIIGIDEEAEQFACALYNTETMIARVVRVWPEAPQPLE